MYIGDDMIKQLTKGCLREVLKVGCTWDDNSTTWSNDVHLATVASK